MPAVVKVTVAMQKQILELHAQGFTSRKIARILKVGRNTIRKILNKNEVTLPGTVAPEWVQSVDWEKVRLEASKGVPLNILACEHAGTLISYVQFWRQFHRQFPTIPQVTMRLTHKPGERCFADWCEGIDIINATTGELQKTSFFCAVMAMSSYTYGEFTLTQKQGDLMRALESAFRYFGGVTPYLVLDNQRAAVNKAHWYDPEVNPSLIDFANHWGFAVIPARPYRPRDKGANESGIGVIQRQFFAQVRDIKFYTLESLNKAFREYLERFNASVMKDWGVSRRERFKGEEELLKPCPANNWEIAEWRVAKVHADCHIQVQKKFYSVPFRYVAQELRVKITARLIEVYDLDLNLVCVHTRLLGKEIYSTDSRHYPEEKLALTQFSVRLALKEAECIGEQTLCVVRQLLEISQPLRYLRRVQGILRLHQSGRVSRTALEHAAKMALLYGKLQYRYIQSTAEYFDKCGTKLEPVHTPPIRLNNEVHLHQPIPLKEEKRNDQ